MTTVIFEMKLSSFIFSAVFALPLENDGKAKPKILCLHGGGQTAWGFSHMKGMTDLVEALPEFEFVFASAPDPNHVWIRDPPGGKDEPTTDPGMILKNVKIKFSIVSVNFEIKKRLGR